MPKKLVSDPMCNLLFCNFLDAFFHFATFCQSRYLRILLNPDYAKKIGMNLYNIFLKIYDVCVGVQSFYVVTYEIICMSFQCQKGNFVVLFKN